MVVHSTLATDAALLLTPADAGRLINVTPGAIRQATLRGRLRPALITPSGLRLYLPDAVLEYAAGVRARRAQRRAGVAA